MPQTRPATLSASHTGLPNIKTSVTVHCAPSGQTARKQSTPSRGLKLTARISSTEPNSTAFSSPLSERKVTRVPRSAGDTVPSNVQTSYGLDNLANSTNTRTWSSRQRPTEFQNLSTDEVMFVLHLYNWGLNRAKQIAAKFRYTIRQPLQVLLVAMCALDRNCNARSAKRKLLSGSPNVSRKRSSTA